MAAYNRCKWLIIGISGVTCGGKTSLALRLREALGGSDVTILHQDHYFYPDDSPQHVRCANLPHNNYDVLSALDMAAMHRDVTQLLAAGGRGGRSVMILEGFSLLNYKPLADLCDLKYYIVLDHGTCQSRRSLRVYEPPDVAGYFDTCVWPEHLNYKKEILNDRSVRILDGTDPDNLQHVLDDIAAASGTDPGTAGNNR